VLQKKWKDRKMRICTMMIPRQAFAPPVVRFNGIIPAPPPFSVREE